MRISILSAARDPSPRTRTLLHSLASAGHEVSLGRLGRRRFGRERMLDHLDWSPSGADPVDPPRRSRPEIIYPDTSRIVGEADRVAAVLEAWVARRPDWPRPERDLIAVVPRRPEAYVLPGQPIPEREPWLRHAGPTPGGRHRGRRVVLAFRSTPAGPGHRLRAAMERAGVEVTVTDRLDFTRLPAADLIVIVESPTPPLEMTGSNPGIPVVFWVHHGEHHLEGNLRLTAAYGADLVLLAHSWHLAGRFDRRVERFPFGAEPSPAPPPFTDRQWDLGFVGAMDGSAYARRRQLIQQAQAGLSSVEVASGIPPHEIPALYRNSRSVLDEGGTRHLPITMRVFEATSAGALLVTDPAPGLELVLGEDFFEIGAGGLEAEALRASLTDGSGEARAQSAHRRVSEMHTYDHRVDLLFRLGAGISHDRDPAKPDDSPVGRFLASHPYGQRILDLSGSVVAPDREVWRPDDLGEEPAPASFDTVFLGNAPDPVWIKAARRYLVGVDIEVGELPVQVRSVTRYDDLVVVDVGGAGYDVETVGGPPPDL